MWPEVFLRYTRPREKASRKRIFFGISSGLLALSLRNYELALDVALRDAGVLLRVDLAEDGTVERLLRRLAVGQRPQMAFEDSFENLLAPLRSGDVTQPVQGSDMLSRRRWNPHSACRGISP